MQTTYFGYDKLDRRVSILTPFNALTVNGYDLNNNLTCRVNPRSYVTYYGYDGLNRVTSTLNPLQDSTYFAYDPNGNLIRAENERGACTYYVFDELDRLSSVIDALSHSSQRTYDISGNIFSVILPYGNPVYFRYDSRNLITGVTDGLGNTNYYSYDSARNRTKRISPRSFAEEFSFDSLNRLSHVVDMVGGTAYFGFDPGGNLSALINSNGKPAYFQYDLIDRITAIGDALSNPSYFGYDLAGNRCIQEDARLNTTYFAYDLGNRISAILPPLGGATYYNYDSNSNLAGSLDANSTTTYFRYDEMDKRVASLFGAVTKYASVAETQYFFYDTAGNMISMSDNWGMSYFSYDLLNRIVRQSTPNADSVYYAYDAIGNRTRVQYPSDGISSKGCYFGYDEAQRMSQLLTPYGNSCYFGYDFSSNVILKTYGNGIQSYGAFDGAERMLSLRYATSSAVPLAYFDYQRGTAGNILAIARENNLVIYYRYDDIDRLTSEVWRTQDTGAQIYAFTYSYDSVGNRTQLRKETNAGAEYESAYYAYGADNSLICSLNQTSGRTAYYYYDNNGALNTLVDYQGTTYFKYNANQLLTEISPPLGSTKQFFYDGLMNRYMINDGGVVTYYLWDGLNKYEERDNSGTLIVRYTYGYAPNYGVGNCVEIYLQAQDATYTLVTDHRGTGCLLIDSNDTVVATREYDAFGVILNETFSSPFSSWPIDMGYQTNWQTIKVGNEFYCLSRYRSYMPQLGIFLSRDFVPNINKYIAFNNNPVWHVDKNGLQSAWDDFWDDVALSISTVLTTAGACFLDPDAAVFQYRTGRADNTLSVAVGAGNALAEPARLIYTGDRAILHAINPWQKRLSSNDLQSDGFFADSQLFRFASSKLDSGASRFSTGCQVGGQIFVNGNPITGIPLAGYGIYQGYVTNDYEGVGGNIVGLFAHASTVSGAL